MSLRSTLERISSPIHSLSIYDFDRSVTSLSQDVFQPGVNIRHLQFSHSHLETLKDNSLRHVRATLESLSIVNGKLTQVCYQPHTPTYTYMHKNNNNNISKTLTNLAKCVDCSQAVSRRSSRDMCVYAQCYQLL